uniref:WAT1-related protein n=1 Tax=Rhizophora mucronata TaxID=61149 RepID=A0A2P2KF24_RHIMU
MAGFAFAFQVINWRFMPHLLMISIQLGYAFMHFITEAAFNHGLNSQVYVTYRFILGGTVMFPFAYFLERKLRPKLTPALLLEISVLSLLGASLTINMYFASLRYTSPTFVTSVINTIPALTFVVAVILRLEVIDLKNCHGIAKILGTLLSLAGVMTITLYKGPRVQSLLGAPFHIRSNPVQKNWMMGSLLVVASCISWSIYFILQTYTLKSYPAPLSLTAWISCLGGAQSAIVTLFLHHELVAWSVTLNIELWSIIYSVSAPTSGRYRKKE